MGKESQFLLVLDTIAKYPKWALKLRIYLKQWNLTYHHDTVVVIGGIQIADSVLARVKWS